MGLSDTRVKRVGSLITPTDIKSEFPLSQYGAEVVRLGRSEIERIQNGEDNRFLVIAGPCSVHDPDAALKYAEQLVALRKKYSDRLCIIMRVYFEKPRTTIGWKGFINDPDLDDSFDINKGSRLARKLLTEIVELGLPCATEFLDPRTPQFLDDCISWAAIGARTVESQTHREMASGLSMPVGFKNGTGGSLQIAIDAIRSAQASHHFVGIDAETGREAIFRTLGNPWGHLVLRGGKNGPNYRPDDILEAIKLLKEANLSQNIVVDCSHANACGDYIGQWEVLRSVVSSRVSGMYEILGAMIESNLEEGKQSIDASPRIVGKSITDACVGWETTEAMLMEAYETLGRSM